MAKLGTVKKSDGTPYAWVFHCPGCEDVHQVTAGVWTFNDSLDAPTFTPSYLARRPGLRCHSFITDGSIRFLADCSHALAGQTVPLPEWDGWGGY